MKSPLYILNNTKTSSQVLKNIFEWHCKVEYINVISLQKLCDKYDAHLSKNALKNKKNTRFITLRETSSSEDFEKRIGQVVSELKKGSWMIIKHESEYCIYDSNLVLDNGWIKLKKDGI